MNQNGKEPTAGFVVAPGQVMETRVRLFIVYQGFTPKQVVDAGAFTRAITDGVRKAIGEFTGTLSSDWRVPGEILFSIENRPGERPAPGPRLIT